MNLQVVARNLVKYFLGYRPVSVVRKGTKYTKWEVVFRNRFAGCFQRDVILSNGTRASFQSHSQEGMRLNSLQATNGTDILALFDNDNLVVAAVFPRRGDTLKYFPKPTGGKYFVVRNRLKV